MQIQRAWGNHKNPPEETFTCKLILNQHRTRYQLKLGIWKQKLLQQNHSYFLGSWQKSGQSHALQSLCLGFYGKNWIFLLIQRGMGILRDALSHFTCGWLVLSSLNHFFTVPVFPCLVSQCKHPLVRLACFNIDRVYLFPLKSSVEQQIQFPTLNTTLGSCMCSLGKCLADAGVLGYSPVLDFWKHCSLCVNVLVKVSVKVLN